MHHRWDWAYERFHNGSRLSCDQYCVTQDNTSEPRLLTSILHLCISFSICVLPSLITWRSLHLPESSCQDQTIPGSKLAMLLNSLVELDPRSSEKLKPCRNFQVSKQRIEKLVAQRSHSIFNVCIIAHLAVDYWNYFRSSTCTFQGLWNR